MPVAMLVRDMSVALKRLWDVFRLGPLDIYMFDATKAQDYFYPG